MLVSVLYASTCVSKVDTLEKEGELVQELEYPTHNSKANKTMNNNNQGIRGCGIFDGQQCQKFSVCTGFVVQDYIYIYASLMAHIEKLRHEDIMFLHDEWIQNDIELVAEFLKGFLFMLPAPICIATRVDLCSIAWIV
ncbi:hypothetical protein MIR68_002629 [Amoeboaphelidium protococcarum]|nr:hypothetical protein MIR68_002629 [Amoeboaphelidium protococcarum]